MKEIVPEIAPLQRQEVKARQQREFRLIGSLRRIAGLRLWQYDLTTGELTEADVKRTVEIGVDLRPVYKNRTVQHELCLYDQALNRENAMKHVRRYLKECGYNIKNIFKK
jgi:hypothetical protein